MQLLHTFIDTVLHLDRTLRDVVQQHGAGTYGILFLIVFCETGLVVTPFLPGDSLLFAAGAVAAVGPLSAGWLIVVLLAAALAGDNVNYWVGRFLGRRLLGLRQGRLVRREHLERTHAFYEKYGAKTIVIARFVPIVRTLAPFVAGLGRMSYRRFMGFSVAGGAFWVCAGVLSGYLFGNVPFVQKNFSLVILAIVAVSLLPAVIELLRVRRTRTAHPAPPGGAP
jgi:membrane-associated protein